MNRKKGGDKSRDGDEVDQLLQATQDEVLLKLSVDSHISHASSNYLDSDLDRRFQALKSGPSVSIPPTPPPFSTSSKPKSPDSKPASEEDLLARFAALKAKSCVSSPLNNDNNPKISELHDDNDSEDEVDKVIRWAMDSARLDPSPPSDDDDDDQGAVPKEKPKHK